MKELTNYFISLLNIKTDSEYVIADIEQELMLVGAENIQRFVSYIRSNFNHVDMEYITGLQKFIKLSDKFKREIASEQFTENQINFIENLCKKVKAIASEVENNRYDISQIKIREIETGVIKPYFTDKEKSIVDKCGGINKCISLQKSESGGDGLFVEMINRSIDKIVSPIQIENKINDRVLMLMGSVR